MSLLLDQIRHIHAVCDDLRPPLPPHPPPWQTHQPQPPRRPPLLGKLKKQKILAQRQENNSYFYHRFRFESVDLSLSQVILRDGGIENRKDLSIIHRVQQSEATF